MSTKIKPVRKYDRWGLKFVFDYEWKQFTFRLAWKPLLVLEDIYHKLWWKNFMDTYKWFPKNNNDTMKTAIWYTKTMLNMLSTCSKEPFVVYVKDQN